MNGGWVGKKVGRKNETINKYGDAVMNSQDIYADMWRRRHDRIKQHVMTEAMLSGVHVDCEVYGQFSDLRPAVLMEEGGEMQWGRARQGVIPDYKFLINSPDGPESSLAELKIISAGKTRFPRGVGGKGTDRRAALIPKEYEAKLWKYDVKLHGTASRLKTDKYPPCM